MNYGVWPGLVLLASIPITIFLFSRFAPAKAAAMTLLGAAMFLPEHAAYDFPVLPPLDKRTLPAAVAAIILARQLPRRSVAVPMKFLLTLGVIDAVGATFTMLTNREMYVIGVMRTIVLPGIRLYDLPGMFLGDFAYFFLPFFIGAVTTTSLESAKTALRVLAQAGLLLSLFCLFEVRMSPNLHTWVYGYAAHEDFSQTLRWGGYRPAVFFYHGLTAAFFMLLTTMATAICVRGRIEIRPLGKYALPYLMFVLVLCKSTGAIAYATLFLPLILVPKPRIQLLASVAICLVVATFPYTRVAGLFPTESLVDWASALGPDRAGSLLFRFLNEDLVLDRLSNFGKLWFGWGGFGRFHMYDRWTGEFATVIDGQWLVLVGSRGIVGLLVVVGLLLWPVWQVWRMRQRLGVGQIGVIVVGLAVMVTVGAVEMLPNDPRLGVHFWLAGCLYGLARGIQARRWR